MQESFVRPTGLLGDGNALMIPVVVSENEKEFTVKASLPGVLPEDVQVMVQGDVLTIRGETKEEKTDEQYHVRERRYGEFLRTVTLPTPVSAEKAQARFEDGVLTLTLPKSEESKPKQIKLGAQQRSGRS